VDFEVLRGVAEIGDFDCAAKGEELVIFLHMTGLIHLHGQRCHAIKMLRHISLKDHVYNQLSHPCPVNHTEISHKVRLFLPKQLKYSRGMHILKH
jgi:hypothetical protein